MFGRQAGTLKKFRYSKDMKAAGAAGLVWTDETFLAYMTKTKRYIGSYIGKRRAKTRMAFAGLRKKADRENLLAYLKEATKVAFGAQPDAPRAADSASGVSTSTSTPAVVHRNLR